MEKSKITTDEIIWNFIYKKWPLYKKNLVHEKDLKNKSIDEITLMKENERDFLSHNIPIILGILGIMTFFDNPFWKLCFLFILLIIGVNIGVAIDEKKENIKSYNKVLTKKLSEQRSFDEKYKKEKIALLEEIRDNTRQKTK